MHTTLGITTEGLPLGILDQNIFSREELPKGKKEVKKNLTIPLCLLKKRKAYVGWIQ